MFPIDPPLDPSLEPGQPGHREDHERIASAINDLKRPAGLTVPQLAEELAPELAGDFASPAQGAKADTAVQPEDLAPVATSGAYADLTGRPTIDGTGSPGGVVAAPVGTLYRDSNGTNGAVLWVKASGTGPVGWRCIAGDTGWRALAAWDADGNYTYGALGSYFQPRPATAGGTVMIRRINDSVAIRANNISAAQSANAGTDRELIAGVGTLTGFRPIGGSSPVVAPLTAARVGTYRYYSDALWWAHPVNYAPGDLLISSTLALATFLTDDPWPTTLPGTAA